MLFETFSDERVKGIHSLPVKRYLFESSVTRRDEASFDKSDKAKYKEAFSRLLNSGELNKIVNIHADMKHDMHSKMDGQYSKIGTQRFLPWHRVYLFEFEKLLKNIDSSIQIPYWNWSTNNTFPEWLLDLLPQSLTDEQGNSYSVRREIAVHEPLLPTIASIKSLLQIQNYTDFTLALEGFKPYGSHNQVHNYVGGTMLNMHSPADPIFWLHHAEIDRIWAIWQLTHANERPNLLAPKDIMDPWPIRDMDVATIYQLQYTYEQMTF